MTKPVDLSANEIAMLVLKAARGGGIPLGHAEDLAAVTSYLDFDRLATCPCTGDAAGALTIPIAFDLVAAGHGPQTVVADHGVIAAYVAVAETTFGKTLGWRATPQGAVFEGFVDAPPTPPLDLGRRVVPASLVDHLTDMAAKILVPETEASRAAGAGAGLTDND